MQKRYFCGHAAKLRRLGITTATPDTSYMSAVSEILRNTIEILFLKSFLTFVFLLLTGAWITFISRLNNTPTADSLREPAAGFHLILGLWHSFVRHPCIISVGRNQVVKIVPALRQTRRIGNDSDIYAVRETGFLKCRKLGQLHRIAYSFFHYCIFLCLI